MSYINWYNCLNLAREKKKHIQIWHLVNSEIIFKKQSPNILRDIFVSVLT